MLSFFVWARPQIAVAIVDPYNTVLCIYSLPECNVDIEHPSYMNLNRLLAQIIYLVIDGISSFDGTLNVDFIEVEVQSSLVPPRIHFTHAGHSFHGTLALHAGHLSKGRLSGPPEDQAREAALDFDVA